MSGDVSTVRVHILDKDYQVASPASEKDALLEAARHLDQQMRAIRQTGKVIGTERIAVMAALNITHELLRANLQSNSGQHDLSDRLRKLTTKIDDTIAMYRQIEL